MTTQSLTKMLVFLLGLYFLPGSVAAAVQVPIYLESMRTFTEEGYSPVAVASVWASFALAFIQLLVTSSWIVASGWWAKVVFPKSRDIELPRLGENATKEVLFSLLGVALLASAAMSVSSVITNWYVQPEPLSPEEARQTFFQYLPERTTLAIQLGLGLWLLFGTKGIVQGIVRARRAGRRSPSAEELAVQAYAEQFGRQPDFRVRYVWLPQEDADVHQLPFQHMRSDFSYEGDEIAETGIYMIWPEFEDERGDPIPEGDEIPESGTATMWIINRDQYQSFHRDRLSEGVRGHLMMGARRLADVEVTEVLGLAE